jgi:hypothetical protein
MIDPFALLKSKNNFPKNFTIDHRQYEQWKQSAGFDILKGKTLAESFCDHFDITDYLLLYGSKHNSDKYIRKTYLR